MFTQWLKSCLHVWGYVIIKFKVMFILLLDYCLNFVWGHIYNYVGKHDYTVLGEMFTPYLKTFLYHLCRHVYTMFEGMFTQCLHIDLYKRVQNVSNDQKWLIIALISTNDLKWLSWVKIIQSNLNGSIRYFVFRRMSDINK